MTQFEQMGGSIDGGNIFELVRACSKAMAAAEHPRVKGGLAPQQLERLKAMVLDDLQESFSVDRLARECRLSAGYFARAFRAATGTTPHRWLTDRRLEAAQSLLRAGRTSIAEIAVMCGFCDQAHFTRTFSREVGSSPAVWARTQRMLMAGGLRLDQGPARAA